MTSRYFDSHCHLTAEQFDADREQVIRRAVDAGVDEILTLGTDAASSRAAVMLAERYPGIYAAVGIHPEAVAAAKHKDLDTLRELAQHPKVVAIGEIGLDYYWDKTTIALQQEWFERQLELAGELNLPVAIHDRDAHDAVIGTLERVSRYVKFDTNKRERGILHAFSGSVEMAQTAFALGYVVSFGGPVTFRNNKTAPDILAALPLDKLVIETDAPYLAPHPLRGKRNEPANVPLVAARIAEFKGIAPETVAAATTENARRVLGIERRVNRSSQE